MNRVKEFCNKIHLLSASRSQHEVFVDFCEISALSLRQPFEKSPENEQRYHEILKRYPEKAAIAFADLLGVVVTSHKIIEIPAYSGRGSEPMAIVNFTTDDGVRYLTKSTGFDVVRKIKIGDKLTIKGTVYGPDRYDKLCCILKRVKVLKNFSIQNSIPTSHWDDNIITTFLEGGE